MVLSIENHAGTHGVTDNQQRRLKTFIRLGIINVSSL